MLSIKNLNKNYSKLKVLEDITLSLEKGMVVGIIGPNGSGKTTLIKCILGLATPNSGDVLYNNKSVFNSPDYRKLFGYMPQIGRYPDNMTIEHLFLMLKDIRKDDFITTDESLIEDFKLANMFQKTLGSLSGGTVQKVSAAIAYLFKPEVLILDEPTAGLDPLAAEILKDKIQQQKHEKLTIITSHILNDLDELATHILFLNDHKVNLFKSMEELKSTNNNMRLGKIIANFMLNQEKEVAHA